MTFSRRTPAQRVQSLIESIIRAAGHKCSRDNLGDEAVYYRTPEGELLTFTDPVEAWSYFHEEKKQ